MHQVHFHNHVQCRLTTSIVSTNERMKIIHSNPIILRKFLMSCLLSDLLDIVLDYLSQDTPHPDVPSFPHKSICSPAGLGESITQKPRYTGYTWLVVPFLHLFQISRRHLFCMEVKVMVKYSDFAAEVL